jgi:hypothetical protein
MLARHIPLLSLRPSSGIIIARAFNSTVASSKVTVTVSTDASGTKSVERSVEEKVEAKPKNINKTLAELDEEVRQKMAALAGEGDEAGVEYEDGKPVAMKRGVRENMFRVI